LNNTTSTKWTNKELESMLELIVRLACNERDYTAKGQLRFTFLLDRVMMLLNKYWEMPEDVIKQ